MSKLAVFFLLIIAPALAIWLALIGLEILEENLLGWLLLGLGIAYPAGAVIHYFVSHRPFWKSSADEVVRQEKGDLSFWLLLPGFLAVFYGSPLELLYLPAILPRNIWMQVFGIALILIALAARLWARAHIRGLYSGHVEITQGHRIIQSGPYHFVRHPGYAGYLLMALGIGIGFSSWIGLLAFLFLLIPGITYRIRVEEKLLIEEFGQDYEAYIRRVKALIPGIW